MFGSTRRPGMRGTNSINLGSLSGTVFEDAALGDVKTEPAAGPDLSALTPTLAAKSPGASVAGGVGIMAIVLVGGVVWMAMSDKKRARKRR